MAHYRGRTLGEIRSNLIRIERQEKAEALWERAQKATSRDEASRLIEKMRSVLGTQTIENSIGVTEESISTLLDSKS